MADVRRIDVRIMTGARSGAGTDGYVYVGVCGREFHLDTRADDFESGSDRTYTLGEAANVEDGFYNDPRQQEIKDSDADKYPVYVRFEPAGASPDWNLKYISVTVNPGPDEKRFERLSKTGLPSLWLGQESGKVLYLS